MKATMINSIEWRVLIPTVSLAVITPNIDLIIRFLIPIVSGVVWVFLKPKVIQLRNNYKTKTSMKIFKKVPKVIIAFFQVMIGGATLAGIGSLLGYEASGFVRILIGLVIIGYPIYVYFKNKKK